MKKRKLKFNLIDVLIVFVLVVAFVVCFKFIGAKAPDEIRILDIISVGEKNYVYYTVEIQRTPLSYKYNYNEGDKVYDSDTGTFLGTVVGVNAVPATSSVANLITGEMGLAEYADKEDVYITLKNVPKVNEKGMMLGKNHIKVGKLIKMQKSGCIGEGYIVDVSTEWKGGAYK